MGGRVFSPLRVLLLARLCVRLSVSLRDPVGVHAHLRVSIYSTVIYPLMDERLPP